MAKLHPTLENIQRLKVQPTPGEYFLVNYLVEHLNEEYEVYFQPYLNGDMPDIVVMRKGFGVLIVEVKDWDFSCYAIDENNDWVLLKNDAKLKSPFQQVFHYKQQLFKFHIDGLAERKLNNKNFYNVIKPYVYFHRVTPEERDALFESPLGKVTQEIENLNRDFRNKLITFSKYEKKYGFLNNKKRQLNRDKGLALLDVDLTKLTNALATPHVLFDDYIYKEFHRVLKPPMHTVEEGIEIHYTAKQQALIASRSGFQKIKGVAGSGKTTVLAKRAVNSLIRTESRVLILTFNKTLKSYIHDKISDVRAGFSWDSFNIQHYHSLISQTANSVGLKIDYEDFFSFCSNINIFDGYEKKLPKFDSILIDEVQDYQPEWIKIIRKYFLREQGEMVLFGDEKQNIYERPVNEKKRTIVQGFGRWEDLRKSMRFNQKSPILDLAKTFQENYLSEKYEIDRFEENVRQAGLVGLDLFKQSFFSPENLDEVAATILDSIRSFDLHINDVCILSSTIEPIRMVDYLIRTTSSYNTMTTFEDEELYLANPGNPPDERGIEEVRSSKKYNFRLNSGKLKLSTTHSFKGCESPTVFLIVEDEDNNEITYTAITRAKYNIMVFTTSGSRYSDFFVNELN